MAPLSINAVLADQGIDPSGVNYLEIPFPDAIPTLEQGTTEAAWLVEPFTTFVQGEPTEVSLAF